MLNPLATETLENTSSKEKRKTMAGSLSGKNEKDLEAL
tara:strand:- start:288 stop:401 length:114 start_codon:yes stop_codon:yes gene_type:complete